MSNDETKLREQIATAAAADDALKLLGDAFARLEREYVAAWKSTPARDAEARERLWQAVQIVGKVESHLRTLAGNRALAARQLAEIARPGERKKILGVL